MLAKYSKLNIKYYEEFNTYQFGISKWHLDSRKSSTYKAQYEYDVSAFGWLKVSFQELALKDFIPKATSQTIGELFVGVVLFFS